MYPYQANRQEVVRVNGQNGASAYMLPPNSSILLLDETAPIIWLKTTDGAGYPTLTPYKIESLQAQVSQLQLAQATAGMLKFPNSWSYGAGPFPPIFGCGCQNM